MFAVHQMPLSVFSALTHIDKQGILMILFQGRLKRRKLFKATKTALVFTVNNKTNRDKEGNKKVRVITNKLLVLLHSQAPNNTF